MALASDRPCACTVLPAAVPDAAPAAAAALAEPDVINELDMAF